MGLLQIRTGCRLHFGLMELAWGEPRRFGGLGLMLSAPTLVLEFSANTADQGASAQQLAVGDAVRDREVPRRIDDVIRLRETIRSEVVDCQVRVVESLPLHSGLGAGTQLASATAAGLELFDRVIQGKISLENRQQWTSISDTAGFITPRWLARHAGRGLRSAVGLHGFVHGGMILDEGYPESDSLELAERPIVSRSAPLPTPWRVVLIFPPMREKISGKWEAEMLAAIGDEPNPYKMRMLELANQAMVTIESGRNFDIFTALIEEYMQFAGQLFSRYQGGMHTGPDIATAARLAKEVGLRGVGQSSWGPTVFGFAPDESSAEDQAHRLRACCHDWYVVISRPASVGAEWRWLRR